MSLGKVAKNLAEVPSKLLEGGEQALVEAADLMVGYAKVYVRVDTGSLRDSIRRERVPARARERVIRVRAGGYVINPKTGKMVDYARYVEAVHPFMRPAYEQVRPQIQDIIRRRCMEQLRRIETAGVLEFP